MIVYKLEHKIIIDKIEYNHCTSSTIFRKPRKGEIFISGAIPEGYIAPNDLNEKYFIGIPVLVKTIQMAKTIYQDEWTDDFVLWRNL